MARSLSNAKVIVSLVAENLSGSFQRRGYAAASQGLAGVAKGSGKMGSSNPNNLRRPTENSWVPDPATGYYRPANQAEEIDVAQLRQIFLKNKIRSQ